ncbi:hypothetical protein PybrP1_013112 [[Pythium] brassicae (nom. inval.)]|nr:hypothetical protein PybrP1_013112 [[Pythium] brassicae (nom. inval.)]
MRDELVVASSGSASESGADSGRHVRRRRLRQRKRRLPSTINSSSSGEGDAAVSTNDTTLVALDGDGDGDTEWACPRCTFRNAPDSRACEICAGSRPARKAQSMAQWLTAKSSSSRGKKRSRDAAPIEIIDSSGDSDAGGKRVASERRGTDRKQPRASARATELWADAHAPSTVENLCVNKKKVQELSEWLSANAWPPAGGAQLFHPRKRLLFLCGPPGSGKSTAVRCIAREMGIGVKEWSENASAGKLSFDRMLQEQFWTPQTSNMDDFMDFIARSVSYAALPVTTAARGSRRRTGEAAPEPAPRSLGHVILVESWPQTWSKQDAAWEERVQRVFKMIVDPAATSQFPVICIFSDVRESKIDPKQLAKLFSAAVMTSPLTTVMSFNSVTATQVKKQLTRIAGSERRNVSAADIQQVVDTSSGDIRHAINMLQLVVHQSDRRRKPSASFSLSSQQSKLRKGDFNGPTAAAAAGSSRAKQQHDDDSTSATRDPFLSDFHVVGKILHRKMPAASGKDSAELSRVDLDSLLDSSSMSLEKALELVHENCVEYFTDVADLGDALELLSMAETLVAESYKGNASTESILVRSVALTNAHPAPTAFRPICGARGFATRQKVALKRDDMLRFTREGNAQDFHYLCSGDTFAFDVEPYLGLIGNQTQSAVHASRDPLADTVVDDEIESSDGGW